ncbi:MAG TPA: xanthine dehydrogenase family protein molybdopterin-binding subunit [Streptosporangiaceae bacterium]|nr:xanthine dehydrogenase family protein molybdopterin-binding subunit [Streptosporangiaceae bacterium]
MNPERHQAERRYAGRRLPRPDAWPLLRGAGRFVADIRPPGCLDAAFTRSHLAHGELRGVDVRPALAAPGVVFAAAASDLPGLPDVPSPPRGGPPPAMARPALARERVRFVGEPIAVVAAVDRYAAADGAELVEPDLQPLPAVLDPIAAAEPGAPALFAGCANVAAVHGYGDPVDDVLAAAPVVVGADLVNQRVSAMSIEPRGIVVEPGGDGTYRVWCSHQAPHRLAADLARSFGLDQAAIRVAAPRVGGAFGAKSQTHPEYLVVFALARRLDRPVRWIEDRAESLTAATHGRDQHARIRIGADETGRILALDADIVADVGGYPHTGGFIPDMTCWVLAGPYATPRLHVRARAVVTNKAPTASYRGAGRPEAAYFLERAIDLLAERLGHDPAEVRRRNFVPDDAFPYTSPTGAVYDSGRYASALDLALDLVDYPALRAEQRRRRGDGDPAAPLLGVGIASWIERSGGARGLGEFAEIEVTADGAITARVGTSSQGQGHELTFAQIAAEALDVPPGRIRVVLGDTGEVRQGTGAFGSRSVQVGGSALFRAGQALVADARRRAADLLGGEVTYADGVFRSVRSDTDPDGDLSDLSGPDGADGADGAELTLARLAARTGRLVAEDVFTPPQAFPFGSYVAVVEVDRRTGQVTIRRLAAVDDCGVVINPGAVEGQIVGSIAQGVGQALYERVVYDDGGQPLTATLLDYFVPTAAEMPDVVRGEHVTPNPNVPLGTKGAGESGCIGAPPAIANAIWDALTGYDRSALRLPFTPDRVWACVQQPVSRGS